MPDDDVSSNVSWGGASESDRMLFTVLSNTDRLDVERLPRLSSSAISTPRIEELPTVTEEEDTSGRHIADGIIDSLRRSSPEPVAPDNLRAEPLDDAVRPQDEPMVMRPPPKNPDPPPPDRLQDNVAASVPMQREEDARLFPSLSDPPPPPLHEEYSRNEENSAREATGHHTSFSDPPPPPPDDGERRHGLGGRDQEQMFEKQSTLYDLNQLEARGIRLSRRWSMDDSLDDMTHELRHHLLVLDERENVGMMKNGLKMALTGLEIVNTRFNLLDLEGWSAQAVSELDKQDGNLSRIYRKYWRRNTSNSPESEIVFSLFSSMGMYHMKRSMARQMMNRSGRSASGRGADRRRHARQADDSSDDEHPPQQAR